MPTHRLYFTLRPLLPRMLRVAVRRITAKRIREKYKTVWPINEAASRTPEGWPGWPNGKKFAVVLTHDVEEPSGLARCQRLAELEMELGFRSSFNFVPEGSYTVPAELHFWLIDRGFEVGVHDLKHDGKLYANQAHFRRRARRINHYLSAWKAVGFRSAFMHHHQEWLHDLNVSYDASTFDTDPFEPQPDGVNTIFPFWVTPTQVPGTAATGIGIESGSPLPPSPSPKHAGYVELPYTLCQDSTLFMLLREKTGEIWQRKLDWVVRHGGMALVNVHPDYLHLKSGGTDDQLTVADHYADWLRYLTKTYGQSFWHALPREVAAFVRQWKHGPEPVRQ